MQSTKKVWRHDRDEICKYQSLITSTRDYQLIATVGMIPDTPIPWRKPSSACHGVRKVDLANPVCLSAASYLKTAKMVVDVTLLGAQHKGKFMSTGGPSESPILCRPATIHFLTIRYVLRFTGHDTIHDTIL